MALNALKHCARLTSGQAGRVHSVFTHACNLLMPNGELWVVQTREMPLAPNGIIVDVDDLRLRFIAGMSVACLPCGGDVSMLGSTPVSTQLISAGNAANLRRFASALSVFLAGQPCNGIRLALQQEPALADVYQRFTRWLTNGEGDVVPLLRFLIGRGEGLTPSGDDFLVGVLLVMENWQHPRLSLLRRAIPPLLLATTDISREMLGHACQGRYSQHLLALMATPAVNFPAVAGYGHTSGLDMLAGMGAAVSVLYPSYFKLHVR